MIVRRQRVPCTSYLPPVRNAPTPSDAAFTGWHNLSLAEHCWKDVVEKLRGEVVSPPMFMAGS